MSKNTHKSAKKPAAKIRYQHTGKKLTSQAGIIPAMHFLDHIGFTEACQKHLDLQRGNSARYSLGDSIYLTIIGIIAGATSLRKVVFVWADQVLREVGGWLSIPDDCTLGRIFRCGKLKHVTQLEQINHILRQGVWHRALKSGTWLPGTLYRGWIDVDSTVKTVYGQQEGAEKGYNPTKKGSNSYHPLVAFCSHTKEILQAWLRSGSTYTSNGIVGFMQQLSAQMPPRMRLLFRGDSGFFVGELMDWLDQARHGYLIKVKLKGLAALLDKQAWQRVPGHTGWEQCDFFHQCGQWERARRFVAVRRKTAFITKGPQQALLNEPVYDYFCYVTTERLSPWQAHTTYGKRATCETWLDEAKNQMGLAQIKSHDFMASSLIFQCAVLAYNTVRWMALLSDNDELKRWEIQTIRTFLVRTAGQLLRGGNQLKVNVPSNHLHPTPWADWLKLSFIH
ncbi:IS1380 family transposase [Oleiphilus messinensis]|uniref:IS1380 family transposase n=1 Tax=Oleiphilus messinensis TaxID=141451 RepID=A0A1Y0I1I3_9GAMM|nr:IS1380 family transposase [Oleiphilus messinensis]ARU54317.1 IS1380 family transposase [Oleiphilus messinensis]